MEGWEQKVLLKFSTDSKDFWTVDDAMKGISIIGGTGSGKTSGSGKTIAIKFLEQGWGGLVLCAKTEEAKLWQQYCKQAGRENDLIIFGKNCIHKQGKCQGETIVFNALHYEMTREGEGAGQAFNLTNIFMNLNKMSNRASGDGEGKNNDKFWDNALKRIISRTIELITQAGEELTFRNMIELIYTAPTENNPYNHQQFLAFLQYVKFPDEEDNRESLKSNFFLKCLATAHNKIADEDESTPGSYAFNTVFRFFTSSLPNMSENTHNTVIESFMGVCEPFLSGILSKHFSGETNLYPEEIYTHKKIIVLDFPVKEYLDAGIMAQSIFKLIFQQSIERRDINKYPTPVFLWADEAQYFLNPYDQIFLTTARGSRTATVFLSQNISNYYVIMGAGQDGKAKVDSLMGNLSTKIFHANSDAETNEYASRLIGRDYKQLETGGTSETFLSFRDTKNQGYNTSLLPQILPKDFITLKSGGAMHNFVVEAILTVSGRKWSTEKNYKKIALTQNFQK